MTFTYSELWYYMEEDGQSQKNICALNFYLQVFKHSYLPQKKRKKVPLWAFLPISWISVYILHNKTNIARFSYLLCIFWLANHYTAPSGCRETSITWFHAEPQKWHKWQKLGQSYMVIVLKVDIKQFWWNFISRSLI